MSAIAHIPTKDLLEYNLKDTLATFWVFNKNHPKMVADNQENIYNEIFKPSVKTILQMELVGMPMDDEEIQKIKKQLTDEQNKHLQVIQNSSVIKMFNLILQKSEWEKDYQSRKAKAKNPEKILPKNIEAFANKTFNPNSGPQLQYLLYEQMGLPVLDLTDTKQPATGGDTLKKLLNHTKEPAYLEIIEALLGFSGVDKILTAFIPAFERGVKKADGMRYLHGGFNLGGTVSGRLSSSKPNMQNLPSGSTYGKLVKQCFRAPSGWLFCGADFSSLEDRINALLTKDPAKLKVYTDGYDGHSLRAFAYFGDQMPDIIDTVDSINSISTKYKHLRQESKSPTFALTFQGTWMTMVKNLGWDEAKAKKVEANYHALYAESTKWVKARIAEAAKVGYAEGAFGLRIRTPLLAQTFLGTSTTPREAEAEARTLGNAISGQSYGLLNSRAMNVFMEKVRASKYRYDILPVAQIHDAGYYLIKDDPEVVTFANQGITEAMAWQDLPEIQHPQVKLSANLDIFWPSWANAITLPNDADQATIIQVCADAKAEYLKKAA